MSLSNKGLGVTGNIAADPNCHTINVPYIFDMDE